MTPARANSKRWLLIAPAAILVGVFLVLPYLNIILISFRPPAQGAPYGAGYTLQNYGKFLSDSFYWLQLWNTIAIAFVTSALCLLVSYPVAWQLARGNTRMRGLYYGIVLSPLLVGIVIRSYGWTIILGNNGLINRSLRDIGWISAPLPLMYNTFGIVLALVHVFLPFMVLPIMGALQSVDPALESAARSLGASRTTIFRRVIFPLSMPGVQSGCILVFILAMSAYVTPALIGGMRVKTMPVTVVDTLIDAFQWPFGSAMALMLSLCGALIVIIFARLTRMKWA
ncbi:ABC transporter permease [Terrarubrum flagellatum]|uniref:ABC transporter permease n=1 Tax=Terrirubrum flagellatum TaxID=2895980 RepID=UPI00314561E2